MLWCRLHNSGSVHAQVQFNYCKSIFEFLIYCLWIKLLLFNYNIQNNLTIILIIMIERSEGEAETYIEAGEFGEGDISEE